MKARAPRMCACKPGCPEIAKSNASPYAKGHNPNAKKPASRRATPPPQIEDQTRTSRERSAQAGVTGVFAGMSEDAADSHARRVLMSGEGPWPLTPLQRALLRILLFRVGARKAITLRDLIARLEQIADAQSAGSPHGPMASEREIKDAIRSLVIDFKVRVGATRSRQHPGYYLITSAEEPRDTARPYVQEIKNLAQRVRVILDPHDLAEFEGQLTLAEKKEAV